MYSQTLSQTVCFVPGKASPYIFSEFNPLNRVFSLTWPTSMQIYWNKRKRLHKKRLQLPKDWFGTPTWPLFHCFGTPIWLPWRHVKTLYKDTLLIQALFMAPSASILTVFKSPNRDKDQFSLNNIHTLSRDKLWEWIKWSPKRKCLDLLSNSHN